MPFIFYFTPFHISMGMCGAGLKSAPKYGWYWRLVPNPLLLLKGSKMIKIPPCLPSVVWKPKVVLLLPGFCTRTLQLLGTSRSLEVTEVKTIILTKNLEVFRQEGLWWKNPFPFLNVLNITPASAAFSQDFSISHLGRFWHFMQIMKCWAKGQLELGLSSGGEAAAVPCQWEPQCSASGPAGGTWMKHVNIFGSIIRFNFLEAQRSSSRLWEPKALDFSCLVCLLARTALLSHLQGIWSVSDSFPGSLSAPARCFRAESHPCISPVTVPSYQLFFSLLGCSRPLICSRAAATAFLVF